MAYQFRCMSVVTEPNLRKSAVSGLSGGRLSNRCHTMAAPCQSIRQLVVLVSRQLRQLWDRGCGVCLAVVRNKLAGGA